MSPRPDLIPRRGATPGETIKGLAGRGKTVLLTTHYMEEAQELADRVAIIAAGEIVAIGAPDSLRRDPAATVVSFRAPVGLGALPAGLSAQSSERDGKVELATETPTAALHELTGWAVAHGVELDELSIIRPSLEDVYLQLTGEPNAGEAQP